MFRLKYLLLLSFLVTFIVSFGSYDAKAQVPPEANSVFAEPSTRTDEALFTAMDLEAELLEAETFANRYTRARSVVAFIKDSPYLVILSWDYLPDDLPGYFYHDSSTLRFTVVEALGPEATESFSVVGSNSFAKQYGLHGLSEESILIDRQTKAFLDRLVDTSNNRSPRLRELQIRRLVNHWEPTSFEPKKTSSFQRVVSRHDLQCSFELIR